MECQACGKELAIALNVGRRDECPFCGSDLHCCLNCLYYEPGAYNDCREPQAERVAVKNRSNFCDYFSFRKHRPNLKEGKDVEEARRKLDSLFKSG